ncbi:MAG TPA: alpha/beta fold hydrolase [Pirellulaceae bacterium]|nr:alpha/beta fold hydrolase [Pirellulaceae bacterium]
MTDTSFTRGDSPLLSRRTVLGAGVATTATAALAHPVWGQAKGPVKKKDEVKDPEPISRETKDGVLLKATYYPGRLGKKAVPVMMIHGWKGQQDEYRGVLQAILQEAGHAILTVDLRGHGRSTRQKMRNGEIKEIDLERMRPADIKNMVLDLEACKKFLVEKNNAGELNVSALCLVAAEFGCVIALQWAVMDWSVTNLPSYRQGKDVQAIAMLSPMESFKGVTARDAINSPLLRGRTISKMIAVGAGDNKAHAEARRLHTKWEGFHGKPPENEDQQDLFFHTADTKLQGTQLLDTRAFNIGRHLAGFISRRLVAQMDTFPWEERKRPV